jgi:hypothetical protein
VLNGSLGKPLFCAILTTWYATRFDRYTQRWHSRLISDQMSGRMGPTALFVQPSPEKIRAHGSNTIKIRLYINRPEDYAKNEK